MASMFEHPPVNCGYHSSVRIFTIVLFCISLMFQSQASAVLPQHPCPMETQTTSTMVNGMDDGCCNDAATALATGNLCKTDAPCVFTGAAILPPIRVSAPALPSCTPPAACSTHRCTGTPSDVWRPPSLG